MIHIRAAIRCSKGVVAVITAMVLPLLLGFTSLGVEVGHWYFESRQMQGAADAAAISAAAQYIADPTGTSYQVTGQGYAELNGYTIPTANVCLITADSDNCGPVLALDSRPIVCATPPCIVVEITQNTFEWLTTANSVRPTGTVGAIEAIPTPVLKARSIVSLKAESLTETTAGTTCILALANDPEAIKVRGAATLRARCGLAVDGGITQYVNGTPLGAINFNGSNALIQVTSLAVAAASTECYVRDKTGAVVPSGHCFMYEPTTTPLPASAIFTNAATVDPYAGMTFPTPPQGVQTGGVALVNPGSGYTDGTYTFTVDGGTGTPAKFTATVVGGVMTIGSVIDPGSYTTFPSGEVTATSDAGGSGATFTLTQGCFTWMQGMTPIPERKYCTIKIASEGAVFPAGNYYITGGDINCEGFCQSAGSVRSDAAGVTFYLMKGEGTGTYGENSYATIKITSGNVALCAPGTSCGTGCAGSCMLFVQDPAATESESQGTPAATLNRFAGNGVRTLSGLIYLPKQTFATSGEGAIHGCVGVIAKYMDIGGTPTFTNGCLPGTGIGGSTTTTTVLSNPYLYQ
jgi:hypothetical protein